MPNTIALVTARGGSKGVPRKNVKSLAGKPLIAWTIEAARASRLIDKVIVSTDDTEIADISRQWGAEVPFSRPAELAEDDSSHIAVIEHAVHWIRDNLKAHFDCTMVLQPTSPLRTADDIDASIQLAMEKSANGVVSVCKTIQNPYLMKQESKDGTLHDFMDMNITYPRRQILPLVYFPNGAIYWVKNCVFLKEKSFFPPGTYPYIMREERSLQIDTHWDFHVMELILRAKNCG